MKKKLFILISLCYTFNASAQMCFTTKISYAVGNNPTSLCHADFNGDGKMDLAVANKSGSISILLGNGAGSFAPETEYPCGVLAVSIYAADFNNDTIIDLATANAGPWTVTTDTGDGSGAFATGIGVEANSPYAVTSADLNSDGNADLAIATQYKVIIALGDGTGNFGAATNFGIGHPYMSIISGYFNNDNIPDLAMAGGSSDSVWILIGNGTGSFGTVTGYAADNTITSVTSADFNSDGKMDIAATNRFSDNISVLIGNGNGGFASPINFASGTQPIAIATTDFNADGKKDLAVVNSASVNVSIFQGDGLGGFSAPQYLAVDSFPNSISIADFNGDGKDDIAVVAVYSNIDTGYVDIMLNCNTTGINQLEEKNSAIKLFPNPNNGVFNIQLNEAPDVKCSLELYNVLAEKIYSINNLQPQSVTEINPGNLSAGVYIAKIVAGDKVYFRKIIRQ